MTTRIVVANQGRARFFDWRNRRSACRLTGELTDPLARLHNRDFNSDRPGRVFDRASTPGRRRGAVGHHAATSELSPRKIEAQRFAQRIVLQLERGRRRQDFDGIVLVAGPPFLGLLRRALTEPLRKMVRAEVPKDLVQDRIDPARWSDLAFHTRARNGALPHS
jgi:protein required for attachment to host cells